MRLAALLTALLLPLGALAQQAGPAVTISAPVFAPASGETVQFRFQAPAPGQAILRIFGPDWRQVAELAQENIQPGSVVALPWDGQDSAGEPVPDESYFPVLEFFGSTGAPVQSDPSLGPPPGQVLVQDLRHDPARGGVAFALAVPARVTVYAGIADGGPLLATLLSNVPLPAGEHLIPWDGRDRSGVVDAAAHPDFRLFADARESWRPAVIVRGSPQEPYPIYTRRVAEAFPAKEPPPAEVLGGTPQSRPRPLDVSPEPAFTLRVKGDPGPGVARVSGDVALEVTLDPAVRIPVMERRFEIVLFDDFSFVTEVEEGRSPATVIWQAGKAPPGRHVLTVNVATLPGQLSAASIEVEVVGTK